MNCIAGFWLTFLASMSNNIFIGVSCRPMSSDQDRIRTSRWWSSTKLDDDQNMMFRSDDTPRDDVTNVVVNNAPARPSSGAVSSSDSRALPVEPFFEDYALLPLNKNNECQYCEGCAFYEELEVAANYGKIILATMGVLILMFLLIYVLYSCSCCCCCHHGPDDEISKPPTTNIRDHSTVVRKKVKFDI